MESSNWNLQDQYQGMAKERGGMMLTKEQIKEIWLQTPTKCYVTAVC
jgi:hypothetical protein